MSFFFSSFFFVTRYNNLRISKILNLKENLIYHRNTTRLFLNIELMEVNNEKESDNLEKIEKQSNPKVINLL